jgi:DNA-binding cell septation regulator SpoVG
MRHNKVKADVVLGMGGDGPLARASVVYGGVVRINGYTIWDKKNGDGYAILPPQNPLAKPGDKYTDRVYGSTKEMRDEIERAVLEEYDRVSAAETTYDVSVHVYKKPKSNDLATADVIFGEEFVVKGFSIYRDKENNELLVGLPKNDFFVDGEWHKGDYTVEAVRYGLIPDIKRKIITEYESELEKGKFERDFYQQRDSDPATYTPTEREEERVEEDLGQEQALDQ